MSNLDKVLRQFEAAEANLVKLERIWSILEKNIPQEINFETNADYENACHSYNCLLDGLPLIDGWKPEKSPL